MAKRPRQADVAQLAGVSRATVSYVVNNRADSTIPITQRTRLKVLEAAKTLGYEPNDLARSLRSGASRTIGFLIPALQNPHYWDILEGAEEEITSRGYHLALEVANLEPERERACLSSLFQQRLDGLIIMPTFIDLFPVELATLRERATPAVFTTPVDGADWVFPDIRGGAEQMMDHLITQGHRRIGFINGARRPNLTQERQEVYTAKLAAAGIPLDEALICHCGFLIEDGYQAARALLDLPVPPSAIWTINDILAFGALRAIHERGLRVPQDTALAGFDDIVFAEQFYPPLTTVYTPSKEIGRRAAQILFRRLEDPGQEPMQEVLPTHLIIRKSTLF
jgi:LacI family transcriptional regulator